MNPNKEKFHPLYLYEWHDWLKENYRKSNGVWLVTYKKHTGKPRVEYEEAVEEALIFGWIDSKPRKLDDERSMLWFSPRKPKSVWAGTNKARVKKLIAENRMTDHALKLVEDAKKDGSWDIITDAENLIIPEDLEKEFDKYELSRENFSEFPAGVRKKILSWIALARKENTRKKRIEGTARFAEDNKRANQWGK